MASVVHFPSVIIVPKQVSFFVLLIHCFSSVSTVVAIIHQIVSSIIVSFAVIQIRRYERCARETVVPHPEISSRYYFRYYLRGSCGFTDGNGCSTGISGGSLFGGSKKPLKMPEEVR